MAARVELALAMPALWALGWIVSTAIGVDVERQYVVFGAAGAITVMALSGLLCSSGSGAPTGRRRRRNDPRCLRHGDRDRRRMSTATVAGVLLICCRWRSNVAFGLLAARFYYPDILQRPTGEVLARFRERRTPLVLIWWAFMLTAVLLAPVVVLLASAIGDADGTLLAVGAAVGVLAATVQFLGLGALAVPRSVPRAAWTPSPTRAPRGAMQWTSSFSRSTSTSGSASASTSATR